MSRPVDLGGECHVHAEARRARYGFVPPGPCQDCLNGGHALIGRSIEYVPFQIRRPELERQPLTAKQRRRLRNYPWQS